MDAFTRDTLLLALFWALPLVVLLLWIIFKILGFIGSLVIKLVKKIGSKITFTLPFMRKRVITGLDREPEIKAKGKLARIFEKLPHIPTIRFGKLTPKRLLIGLYFIALMGASIAYTVLYFYSRPYVTYTDPADQQLYVDNKPAIVMFDKPFHPNTMKIETAPKELEATLEFISPFTQYTELLRQYTGIGVDLQIYTGVKIKPVHSVPYDTGVIFYLSGITNVMQTAGSHEQGYVLSTPKFPTISDVSIKDKAVDVSVTSPIQLTLDSAATGSFKLIPTFEPAVDYTIVQDIPTVIQLKFNKPLEQGKEYKLELQRAKQVYNYKTGQAESTDEPDKGMFISFKTVTPPGIKNITTQGSSVPPMAPIVVTFTEPMNTDSVEKGLNIEPAVDAEKIWNEDKSELTLKLKQPMNKGTGYKMTFTTDIMTAKGGVLMTEYVHQFETLGFVKVIGTNPKNGAGNVSVTQQMQITFDQGVDHGSAEQHISISPSAGLKYSWSNNSLSFSPSSELYYQTKYTVTVKAGIKSIDGWDSKENFTFTFTTRPQTITISVPLMKQSYGSFHCNLVAAKMALAAKGVSVPGGSDVGSLISYIGSGQPYNKAAQTGGNPNADWIDQYGVHWDPIAQYIRYRGRGADVYRGWNTAGIAKEIAKGNPVIVWWWNGFSYSGSYSWYNQHGAKPNMHSVVVYGFKGSENAPTHFYVRDPWPTFNQELYTASAFKNKWSYFNYTAVVVR